MSATPAGACDSPPRPRYFPLAASLSPLTPAVPRDWGRECSARTAGPALGYSRKWGITGDRAGTARAELALARGSLLIVLRARSYLAIHPVTPTVSEWPGEA